MRKKVACPGCVSQGRDRSADNLSLFPDDPSRGWCMACQKAYSVDGSTTLREVKNNKNDGLELSALKQLPIRALTHKPITKETCEKYGVRVGMDEETGDVGKVYYPYTDQDGNIVGFKGRALPKDFFAVGRIKGLFGQSVCKKGGKLLVITEGEEDTLAAYQMLKDKGKDYNVVSLPHGASTDGSVDTATRAELEFITSHSIVVLALDNDKPGQATAKALAELICSQCRVKLLKLSRKDAGQMLIEGMGDDFEKQFYTKDFSPDAVVAGHEITLETIKKPKPVGYSLPYPELDKKLHGLRKGEITLFCAGSGIGKSTVTREISYHLATKHNLKIATIALETPVEDAARAFIAIDLNVPLHKLMFHANKIKGVDESYERLMAQDQLYFLRHWGSIESEKLVQKCHYFVKARGVDFIVLDHISMVVAGGDITDERKSIDVLMEKLTNLVVETGVGVLGVVHLKRVPGKNYNSGDEVELTDLRGSAGLEQMSWAVIGLERDQQHETQKDYSRIRVLKNRTLGFTGVADTLRYDHETGRLLAFSSEY